MFTSSVNTICSREWQERKTGKGGLGKKGGWGRGGIKRDIDRKKNIIRMEERALSVV